MAGRSQKSSYEFGVAFYPTYASTASTVKNILEEYLPIDLAQLEPSDRLVQDLRMDALDSMSTVEFIIALEKHFDISIADKDAENMHTFDDVCSYVIKTLEKKETRST